MSKNIVSKKREEMKTNAEKIKKLRAKNRELKASLANLEHTSFKFSIQMKSANAEIVSLKRDIGNLSIILMEHLGCTEQEIYHKSQKILENKQKKERSIINPFGS